MLGSVLDPLADKCLISILCTSLAYVKLIPSMLCVRSYYVVALVFTAILQCEFYCTFVLI